MDRRELYLNEEENQRILMSALQARMWTALPGIINTFNAAQMTVTVRPAVQGRVKGIDGEYSDVVMPLLLDCPVVWQGGGGVTTTFPIQSGDECLVVFASRCIDTWWQRGGVQRQIDLRMHNLSDGFALVGVRSLARSFDVDTVNACVTTDDGMAYFKINPTNHSISIVAPGGVTINGVTIDTNGNLSTPATITGQTDVIAAGKSGKGHVHAGVQSGTSDTDPPGV